MNSIEVIGDENDSIFCNNDFDSLTQFLEQARRPKSPSKFYRYFRIYFQHFCLFASLGLYILIGAVYFYYHESAFEVESKTQELTEYFTFRKSIYDKIWRLKNSTKNDTTISRQNFDNSYHEMFDNLILHISRLQSSQYIKKNHLLNETQNDKVLLWSFSNSIFFSTTVMTTIGFTHKFAPATTWGRIGVVIFGFFGIPLFIITVGDIGKLMSEILIWFYQKSKKLKDTILLLLQKPRDRYLTKNEIKQRSLNEENTMNGFTWMIEMDKEDVPLLIILLLFILFFGINSFLLSIWKGWSFIDSCFIWINTMTTIGFGNKIPSENDNIFLIMIFIIFSIAFVRMSMDLLGIQYIQKIHYFGRKFQDTDLKQLLRRKRLIEKRNAVYSMESVD